MDEQNKENPQATSGTVEDDFTTEYANNTAFESTVWDLKLIFGEFSMRANGVDWHTSITIPWAQAKLLNHYLEVNIRAHEIDFGTINVPATMIPDEPTIPSDLNDKKAQAIFEILRAARQRLLDGLRQECGH